MEKIIYTHCDFDGAASAALMSYVTGIIQFRFATPENIYRQAVSGADIVCDLPYVSGCGMWFDHHASNIQELADRGLNPENIAGGSRAAASAARVIYDHYLPELDFPDHLHDLVKAADLIDTMNYGSLEEWLAPEPANILNETININSESFAAMNHHLDWLTVKLRDLPLAAIAKDEKITSRYRQKLLSREKDIEFLQKTSRFIERDTGSSLVVIDCSNLSFAPKFNKTLALVNYPAADYILLVASDFAYSRKTNNLKLSLAKNFLQPSAKQLGEFLEDLGLGGGHDNAAGGMIRANSKAERLKKLAEFMEDLFEFIDQ